jgi:hypothetical protein
VADKEIRLGIDVVINQEAAPSSPLRAFIEVVEKHFKHPLEYGRDNPLSSFSAGLCPDPERD